MLPSRLRPCAVLPFLAVGLAFPAAAAAVPGDFVSGGAFPLGNTPYDLATGDFNGDAVVDAAAPNANGSNVSVLLGNGDGTFTTAPSSPIAVGGSPLGIAAANLNSDGDLDLAVVQAQSTSLKILLGNGDGTFTAAAAEPATGASPRAVQAGILNGDSFTDLAVTNRGVNETNSSVSILLGDGGGGFTAAATSPEAVDDAPFDLMIADLNGGAADIATANLVGDDVTVLLGDGLGDFTEAASSPEAADGGASAIVAANLSADANLDLAVANAFGANTSILLGDGTGNFTQPLSSPEPEGDNGIAAGDLDGDGDADLVSAQNNDELVVLLNDGAADFSPAPGSPEKAYSIATQVAIADTDGDGDLDVLVAGGNGGDYRLTSLLNDEPDADADGVADLADECPSVPDPAGCPALARTITLKYVRRAGTFKGKIRSEHQTCVGPREKISLLRRKPSGDVLLDKARTGADGKYRIRRKVRRGQYLTRVNSSLDPAVGRCLTAFSPVVQR